MHLCSILAIKSLKFIRFCIKVVPKSQIKNCKPCKPMFRLLKWYARFNLCYLSSLTLYVWLKEGTDNIKDLIWLKSLLGIRYGLFCLRGSPYGLNIGGFFCTPYPVFQAISEAKWLEFPVWEFLCKRMQNERRYRIRKNASFGINFMFNSWLHKQLR